MKKAFQVYGIGNAIIDLQLQISEQEFAKFGLTKGGMSLVDQDSQQSLLQALGGEGINRASGGSAANTIIALAQLGVKCAYGCVVADDQFGEFYLNEMRSLGVSIDIEPLAGAVTGSSVIMVTPDSERTMNTHLGASATFAPEHVSEELIKNSDWLYVEGYLFSTDTGREAIEKAITLAKKHQTKVAITFSDRFIVEFFKDSLVKAVESADLIFANIHEAEHFTSTTEEGKIFEELCAMVPNVALTLSERGAKVKIGEAKLQIEPFPTRAVDSTGAGDIFAGGFLYGLTANLEPNQIGRIACRLGSEVVSQLGPRLNTDLKAILAKEGITVK